MISTKLRNLILAAALLSGLGFAALLSTPARCEYGCAGQVCGNGLTCVYPCSCFDNGTGPGRCISP